MNRRNFIQTSGASLVSLFLRTKVSAGLLGEGSRGIKRPDNVTAIINGHPVSMSVKSDQVWVFNDVTVKVKEEGNGMHVDVEGASSGISAVTLHWKLPANRSAPILNDHWERTYGDVSWHDPERAEILPWYFMQRNGKSTLGFGVRTGAKAFCFWQVGEDETRLTLDTRNGGDGVQLGGRGLRAATIVTIQSSFGETPFETTRHFMAMMCKQPRMPKKPVYGINDWYFTYGRNSEKLILDHTGLIAPMADGLSNRPFSVIDAGWFKLSSRASDDIAWSDNMGEANSQFPDMSSLANKIKKLGNASGDLDPPALWESVGSRIDHASPHCRTGKK